MGYWFNKQTSLASISLHFVFFKHEPQLLAYVCKDVANVINLDDPNVCIQVYEQNATFFKSIMHMEMENLVSHYRDTL
jgi:DNA-directed RNA polymerase beta' subunit